MNKIKNIITIVLFAAVCLCISAFIIFAPKKDYSMSERRALKKSVTISAEALNSGKFMSDFDDFALDQFPLRDGFRSLKANLAKYVLLKKDNHGLYLYKGYLSKMEYPLNQEKLNRNLAKINGIYKQYLEESDCKIYLSIIPDKNFFLAPVAGYPTMDYNSLMEKTKSQIHYAKYIDIFPSLQLESYYYTDQHWKQECILPTAYTLAAGMNAEIFPEFETKLLPNPFNGTYVGQAALKVKAEEIKYLTNIHTEQAEVKSYNSGSAQPSFMYDMKKAKGRDPYEMFLGGSDALLTIDNPNATTNRELVIFRDSFGSSLTPLLVSAYKKITLVDLRYIQGAMLKNYIDFSNQDVLFLYSTLVLNN